MGENATVFSTVARAAMATRACFIQDFILPRTHGHSRGSAVTGKLHRSSLGMRACLRGSAVARFKKIRIVASPPKIQQGAMRRNVPVHSAAGTRRNLLAFTL